jgi:phosphatidylglycerol---prolipoprotein diacylglyceryl transferase
MLYFGTVCGVLGATRWAPAEGLDPARVCAALLVLFLPALIGARLLFAAFHWKIYRNHPRRLWHRCEGGAALYGGFILSFLVSLPVVWALSTSLWAFWDAATVALLIGMIFTRIGCLLAGCCAGRPSDSFIAFYLPDAGGIWQRRLPAQAFEAGLAAALLLGSTRLSARLPFTGSLFLFALAGYGGGRWMLEPTRQTIDRAGRWSLNRIISAAFVVLATTAFLFMWTLQRAAAHAAQ